MLDTARRSVKVYNTVFSNFDFGKIFELNLRMSRKCSLKMMKSDMKCLIDKINYTQMTNYILKRYN